MDTLNFKISINKYYDGADYILLYVLVSLVVLGLCGIIPSPSLILILGLFIFVIVFFLLMYFIKVKQKFKILSIKENHLIIENNPSIEIDYTEIQNITLKYASVKETSWLGYIYIPISIPNTGQENIIKINEYRTPYLKF